MKRILLTVSFVIYILLGTQKAYASELISPWINTTALPQQVASHTSFAFNSKLYMLGGAADLIIPQNISSTIDSLNGSISQWLFAPINSPAKLWHSTVVKNNYVYMLGGANLSPFLHTPSVFRGSINSSGIIDQWDNLNQLPESLSIGAAVIAGNRIYYAGGINENGVNSDIYTTVINTDGTINNWTTAGQLPEALTGLGLIENNGYLIVLSGENSSGEKKKQVYKTAIQSNGTISNWEELKSLPIPVYRGGIIKIDSTIITVGGIDTAGNTHFHDKVFYSNVNSDGSISDWSESQNSFPQSICCGATTYFNGYIYYSGGYNLSLGSYQNTVYLTKINSSLNLDVPYFSQNALPWGPTEYDHTISLGGFPQPTMDRWGCAVTSAAMVLNFHEMTEFQNGDPVDPGTLNNWLKNNNGYITGKGKGGTYSYISWPAVSKLTKDLYDAGKSTVKLMHKRAYPSAATTALLDQDLTVSKFPDILFVKNSNTNGHFVVAKGKLENTYSINDPEWNYLDLTNFGNTYLQVDRYIPSQTDLSYIEIIVNPEAEILVTDAQGRKTGVMLEKGNKLIFNDIPNATYNFEHGISNPAGNIVDNLGTGVHVFLLPEPNDGEYQISLSSNSIESYSSNIHTFQVNGDNALDLHEGTLNSGSNEIFQLNFTQNQVSSIQKIVSFQTVLDDLGELQNLGDVEKRISRKLINLVKESERKYGKGNITDSLQNLSDFETLINDSRGVDITETAYQILLEDVVALKLQVQS